MKQFLPTPSEIFDKTVSSTSQVSLRVKDSTREFFEQQAKAYLEKNQESVEDDSEKAKTKSKISANTLMTSVLDLYAESYTSRSSIAHTGPSAIRTYLQRQAEFIGHASPDRLIYRIFRDREDMDGEVMAPGEICELFYQITNNTTDDVSAYVIPGRLYEIIRGSNVDQAKVSCSSQYDAEGDLDILEVPIAKWPIVAAMTDSYIRYMAQKGEDDAQLDLNTFTQLAELINNTDDHHELAHTLADFLADYAEQVYAAD